MSFPCTLAHFLRWAAPLAPLYLLACVIAGAVGFIAFERAATAFPDPNYGVGVGYSPADGALYGAFFGLAGGLPVFLVLWLGNTLLAVLFRRDAQSAWVRWVFWGFGLLAGLMPLFAFLSSGLTFTSSRSNADLAALDDALQARALALAEAGQTATLLFALTLFALALFASWWNWRAAGAWAKQKQGRVE
jgi:hypothetical protein